MIKDPNLKMFPQFAESLARFGDWWRGANTEPVIECRVKPHRTCSSRPVNEFPSLRHRWLDVEWNLTEMIDRIESRPWVADTFPVLVPNVGPDLTSTLWGTQLEFGETTSWSSHPVHETAAWNSWLDCEPDWSNPYWNTIEQITKLALERAEGRYLVGLADLHGAFDILTSLRGPQDLCFDLADDPELIGRVALRAADLFNRAYQENRRWLLEAGQTISTTWTRFAHDGPAYVTSCDFWCLVSEQMACDYVLPTILAEANPLDRAVFHLDGPAALRHLDTLLSIPEIQAIQWVFGAGNGPATRWLDVYRKILDHGCSIQVLAESRQDAIDVFKSLGPRGVWISLSEELENEHEAREFLSTLGRTMPRSA